MDNDKFPLVEVGNMKVLKVDKAGLRYSGVLRFFGGGDVRVGGEELNLTFEFKLENLNGKEFDADFGLLNRAMGVTSHALVQELVRAHRGHEIVSKDIPI